MQRTAKEYYNRGLAHRKEGKTDLAIADYSTAIQLDPKYVGAYYDRGLAYYIQRKIDLAIADYSEAIRLDPKHAGAYNNRGLAYEEQDKIKPAIADYSEAIRLNPKDEKAYRNRGNVYYDNRYIEGFLDLAIADYSKVLELKPKDVRGYNNRGLAYEAQGKMKIGFAIADYNDAIRLDPEYEPARNNLKNLLKKHTKLEIFDAMKKLPLPNKILISFMEKFINPDNPLGERFWEKEGATECSLKAGVLKDIREHLGKLYLAEGRIKKGEVKVTNTSSSRLFTSADEHHDPEEPDDGSAISHRKKT